MVWLRFQNLDGEIVFSSLDQVDIVARDKSNRLILVQSDHRSSQEIEKDVELSAVFALARVLNAFRVAKSKGEKATIIYDFNTEAPPDFLSQAIVSAGGSITLKSKSFRYRGKTVDTDKIFDKMMAGLANKVVKRERKQFLLDSLKDYERSVENKKFSKESDEVKYWTMVIELAAFAGEVLRKETGGGWIVDDREFFTLPFAFHCKAKDYDGLVNFIGKAIKFLNNPEGDSLAYLVENTIAQADFKTK